jgi:hypothetical protein
MYRIATVGIAFLLVVGQVVEAAKTVHVRGYYRKDGTYVHAHTRSAPSNGSFSYVPPTPKERTSYREEYREVARTSPRTSVVEPIRAFHSDSPTPPTNVTKHPEKHVWRHWKDASGQFTIYAKLVTVIGDHIKLELDDGKVIDVPIDRLSAEDQAYLKEILR